MPARHQQSQEIYRLSVIILALVFAIVGVALLVVAKIAESEPELDWLTFWPISEVGGTLFTLGLVGFLVDFIMGRRKDEADDERTRRLLKEAAPDFSDAVIRSFAASPDNLKRVATPELLDQLIANGMGLRLHDAPFATEIYAGLLSQVIRAAERWLDASVRIRLSCIQERSTEGTPLFAIDVQWEYTVVPSHAVQRFACTSDREEFRDLISDVPATSTWFMTPRPGMAANERESYELLTFAVDGEERQIRRSERKSSQTYSVNIGEEVVRAAKPVRISFTYRTVMAKDVHRLFIAIAQPTRNLKMTLDYTDTDIARVVATEPPSADRVSRTSTTPREVAAKEVSVEIPGWLLPPAEVSYVWTLVSEVAPTGDELALAA